MSRRRQPSWPGRLLRGCLLVVSALAVLCGPAPSAATALAATDDPVAVRAGGLELRLGGVSPAALGPGDELVVRGTARNLGTTRLGPTTVTLWLRPDVLESREAIETWLKNGKPAGTDRQLPVQAVLKPLDAGAGARFSLTVPPDQTGLYSWSSFGPRAIWLQARAGGRVLSALRTTTVWVPTEMTGSTRLSVVVPITSSDPTVHAGAATSAMAAALLPGGRLDRVLAAADDRAMAWAIDPAVLASADALSKTGVDAGLGVDPGDPDTTGSPPATSPGTTGRPTTSGSPTAGTAPATSTGATAGRTGSLAAPPTAATVTAASQDWLGRFRTGRDAHGVIALPYADPDLMSLLRTRRGLPLLRAADVLGQAAASRVLGHSLDSSVAWPAEGRLTSAAARSLVRSGRTAVILDSGTQRADPDPAHTPTGRSTIRTPSGPLQGLLYDQRLSDLISSRSADGPPDTQTLLAELAAVTMQQPNVTRHLLVVTPRSWDPNPVAVRTTMDALGSAPWISLRGLSELRQAPGPPRGEPAYRKAWAQQELPVGNTTLALRLSGDLTTFSPVLKNPQPVIVPLSASVASLLSVAWRSHPEQLRIARSQVAESVTDLVDGVQLETGTRSKLVTGRSTKIPITVFNRTPYPVRVVVRLRPQSGQLVIARTEAFYAPPRTRTPVYPAARAVASGNVTVEAKLMTPTGVALGPGQDFVVRVRPEWETWGMIVAGSFLGMLVLTGLLRGIRRGRTVVPIDAVPDIDEQATRQAAAAAGPRPDSAAGRDTGSSGTGRTDGPTPEGDGGRPADRPLADGSKVLAGAAATEASRHAVRAPLHPFPPMEPFPPMDAQVQRVPPVETVALVPAPDTQPNPLLGPVPDVSSIPLVEPAGPSSGAPDGDDHPKVHGGPGRQSRVRHRTASARRGPPPG